MRFTFAYSYKLASYEAIWGTVDGYHSRSITGADLMGFTTNMSAAWPWSVVSRAQLHRFALQFEELLKELRAWDEESAGSSSDPESDSSEEAAAPPAGQTQTTRGGRTVPKPNYKV